jgi:hypothetical protein
MKSDSSTVLQNRLGAERIVPLDHGIFAGLRGAAETNKIHFPDLLAVTLALALTDGAELPTPVALAEQCRIPADSAKLCIQLLRTEGWLTGVEVEGGKRIWLLKRKDDVQPIVPQASGPTLPTRLEELFQAWVEVTNRPISSQVKAAALKELAKGDLLGSPKQPLVVASFFHRLRPSASIIELVQELSQGADPLQEVALRWKSSEEPDPVPFRDLATACHGLWLTVQTGGRFHYDYYRILGAVFMGMTPQIFRSYCKSRYKLSEAIDLALRRKTVELQPLSAPVEADDRTTLERFMNTTILL